MHGVAWLSDAPDVEKLTTAKDDADFLDAVEDADKLVSTMNPAISPDESDAGNAPLPKTKPHVCNDAYSEVEDLVTWIWWTLLPLVSATRVVRRRTA